MSTSPPESKKILIVTGEVSGDQLGASLIRSFRRLRPDLQLHAVGGSLMQAERPAGFLSSGTAHATGLTEVLRHLPDYLRLFKQILGEADRLRPDLAVLIDNPGFNLRLAKKLKALGIPVVGYVSPQVWAWKEGRTRVMADVYKKVLTLFDFEEGFLKDRGVQAKWVGHPIVDAWPQDLRSRAAGAHPRIVLLPGSRPHEVKRLLPVMLEAAVKISRVRPDIRWSLLEADTLSSGFYDALMREHRLHSDSGPCAFCTKIQRQRGEKQNLFWNSDLAWACSGTVTLECALAGLPAVLGYRASALTAWAARRVVKVKYLGMPNLLAHQELMPELLQENFTAQKLEQATFNFLNDPALLNQTRAGLLATRSHLGAPDSPTRAAQEILSLL